MGYIQSDISGYHRTTVNIPIKLAIEAQKAGIAWNVALITGIHSLLNTQGVIPPCKGCENWAKRFEFTARGAAHYGIDIKKLIKAGDMLAAGFMPPKQIDAEDDL